MTIINIRNAMETALDALTPAIQSVHENEAYVPVVDVPYQEVYLLVAKPANPTLGDGYFQERGVFQINLQYPRDVGSLAAATRAEAIRALFPRGATFTNGGITVQIDEATEIGTGRQEGDRWMVPVKVRWHADIFT